MVAERPRQHLAFFLSDLRPGGVQHSLVRIATGMARCGCRVTLLVCEPGGKLEQFLPEGIELVHLDRASKLRARMAALLADPGGWRVLWRPLLSRRQTRLLPYLPGLADWLRRDRPDTLFAAAPAMNIWAYCARRLAAVETRLVLSERTHFSVGKPRKVEARSLLAPLMARAYAGADRVVAVSHGVADDLVRTANVAAEHITVIHNPSIGPDFAARMAAPLDHPWFDGSGAPVLLAVGRLAGQKDVPTLIEAFAIARRERPLRLVLLGDSGAGKGPKGGASIDEMIATAGIAADVDLIGYDPNPIRYMARADLFVLSSRFEGFPNVLLEAMACGCPVVSTDCPSGPFELLDGGRLGRLVPVGKPVALAEAILRTLEAPPDRAALRERAATFDYDASIRGYRNVLLGRPQGHSYEPPPGPLDPAARRTKSGDVQHA